MAHGLNDTVLLNTGSQILLNDGESVLLLNSQTGVFTEGVHSTPALVLPRKRREEPIEFIAWFNASLLTPIKLQNNIKATVLSNLNLHTKVKALLLKETQWHKHFKASLVKQSPALKYKLVKNNGRYEYKLESYSTVKTIKKLLLKNMKDMLGNE